jgi:hypothetical protein
MKIYQPNLQQNNWHDGCHGLQAGTMIATPNGEVEVQRIMPGDPYLSVSGDGNVITREAKPEAFFANDGFVEISFRLSCTDGHWKVRCAHSQLVVTPRGKRLARDICLSDFISTTQQTEMCYAMVDGISFTREGALTAYSPTHEPHLFFVGQLIMQGGLNP